MLTTVLLIVVWVSIACLGDMFFKTAKSLNEPSFAYGLLCYISTAVIAVATFRRTQFGAVVVLWTGSSLLVSMVISVFWYREPLTVVRAIALICIFAALILTGNES